MAGMTNAMGSENPGPRICGGGVMRCCFLLLVFVVGLNAHAEDTDVTIYVDDAYEPLSFSEEGEAKGMYIDVLRTAFSRMEGFDVTMKPVPWERGKYLMKKGEGFGLAPAFFHGHDWPYLYPYSLPFHTETIQAVCTEDVLSSPRPDWPDDYKGLSIGNVMGFDGWGGETFRSLVEEGEIDYEEVRGARANILKLAEGRVDCIMMEQRAFDYTVRSLRKSGVYKDDLSSLKKGAIVGEDPVYIGYSKPAREKDRYPYQFEFMQAFDSVIYRMRKAGEIEEIMDSYNQ